MKRVLTRTLVVIVAVAFVLFWVAALYGGALNRTSGRLTLSPLNLANVADGIYEGSATILHVAPKLHVTVTTGRITAITVVSPIYGDVSGLTARVIKAQSLDVDGITGATVSTKAVLKAVGNALAARP
jgi:uncharacterized protein with FMN-binding domain